MDNLRSTKQVKLVPCDDCFYEIVLRGSHITSIRFYPDMESSRNWLVDWEHVPNRHKIRILQTVENLDN